MNLNQILSETVDSKTREIILFANGAMNKIEQALDEKFKDFAYCKIRYWGEETVDDVLIWRVNHELIKILKKITAESTYSIKLIGTNYTEDGVSIKLSIGDFYFGSMMSHYETIDIIINKEITREDFINRRMKELGMSQ
jgi:hypothetical protein